MLTNKTAFITGSTSGIGLAIAKKMAQSGARVFIHGLVSQAEGQQIAKDLADSIDLKPHQTIEFIDGNLAKPDEVQALCAKVLAISGGVDVLVNNAGIQLTAPIQDMPPDKWESILAINLSSAFYTMHALLPSMHRKGFGRIINIASVHGLVASINKAPYVASKFGLVGLTKVVALENAARGITANCICPGWVETPLIEPQIALRAKEAGGDRQAGIRALLAEKQPSGRMSTPEDIAEVALFLCSPAAHNITGVALPVDGGWTAQ